MRCDLFNCSSRNSELGDVCFMIIVRVVTISVMGIYVCMLFLMFIVAGIQCSVVIKVTHRVFGYLESKIWYNFHSWKQSPVNLTF